MPAEWSEDVKAAVEDERLLAPLRECRLVDERPLQTEGTGGRLRALLGAGRSALALALRRMPLLLALLIVLFVTGESWQFFGRIEHERFWMVLALFVLAILIVVLVGVHRAIERASSVHRTTDGESSDERNRRIGIVLRDTPAGALHDQGFRAGDEAVPGAARKRLWRRTFARLLFETTVVGLTVAAVFVLLGVAAVDKSLTQAWAARGDEKVVLFPLKAISPTNEERRVPIKGYKLGKRFGTEFILSEPLLRVATLLGVFAALTFAVEMFGDPDVRRETLEPKLRDFERAVLSWRLWSAARATAPPPRTEPDERRPTGPSRGSPGSAGP